MLAVWFAVGSRWCVLRRAIPGGRVASLCLAGDGHEGALPYEPLCVTTEHPGELACPACERELRAWTAGAAVALEPEPYDDLRIEVARTPTANLRGKMTDPDDMAVPEWDFEGGGA
jgi:hypothetical protein